jgi:hypothetical protein
MFIESRSQQARRWAKYPATLLFVLSLVWLLNNMFQTDWAHLQPVTETGGGILLLLLNLLVIPLGSVVVGIYLLYGKRWAYVLAPLLPLLPLIEFTVDRLRRISGKFAAFHDHADSKALANGVMDSLVLLGLWVAYGLMLWYLAKAWRLLKPSRPVWGLPRAGSVAGGETNFPVAADAGGDDNCLIMPEMDDAERA